MSLLRFDNAELAFGTHILLDKVNANLATGARVGLLGRNGAGKSTLLSLIAGSASLDGGLLWRTQGLKVASLSQELPEASDEQIYRFVAGGLAEVGSLLSEYHALTQETMDEQALTRLQRVQQQLEAHDGWTLGNRIDTILQRLQLNPDQPMKSLSGGWRRRAALARALVQAPDVLLLDEPTNHLDIAAIEWLEQEVANFPGAIVLVTHDRSFLQRVTNEIWELDRGHLFIWHGDYRGYLDNREQRLASEEKTNREFDKKLAEEERWIRTGIKARRTRNEGRVRALKQLRVERAARREQQGSARLQLDDAARSGKLAAELSGVCYGYGDRMLVNHFDLTVMRGDRIGLIGPNGVGKSTLLKLLLGDLQPQTGTIKHGTKVQVAYFDQLRSNLDLNANAIDNVAGGREFLEINGKNLHAVSYLNNFLFDSARLRTPVWRLSGGEQNRLILAKLFSQPANVLVLDEPTNDLDMETLELLEELLADFSGTILLVSHDREFLDNVVTSSLVFDGNGNITEHVGGYSDWQAEVARNAQQLASEKAAKAPPVVAVKTEITTPKKTNKLSYKLQRELDELPARIEALDAEIQALTDQTMAADFFSRDHRETEAVLALLSQKQAELDQCYVRWEELESAV